MSTLYFDFETYSPTPIRAGAHRYAQDECEILLFGWAIDDGAAQVWDVTTGEPMPGPLRSILTSLCTDPDTPHRAVAHNGMMFDNVVLSKVLGMRIPFSRLDDTMVRGYQLGLPGSLADLSVVFGLAKSGEAKDKDGVRLISLFCAPLPASRTLTRATRETHPEDWAKFIEYCRQDIVAMRALYKAMPSMDTALERQWQITDATINWRGFAVDTALVRGALMCADEASKTVAEDTARLTGGAVSNVSQRQRLLDYIKATYGVKLPSLGKSELERALRMDALPDDLRDLLRLRLAGSKSSVAKYSALDGAVNADGRLRGTLQFRGAARTGRFAGRIFQPQNLPRPSMGSAHIESAIKAIKAGVASDIYTDVNDVLSNCLRGCIVAPEGKKLLVADYSNIEGRVLAWLAGEQWKIEAFEAADRGEGADLYKLAYGRTFGKDPKDVTKDERQIGKVLELALGYGGGAGAFVTFANAYGLDLDEMGEKILARIDRRYVDEAVTSYGFFEERGLTQSLKRETFIACDAVKRAWREANSHIASFWTQMEEACKEALTTGGVQRVNGRLAVRVVKGFLQIRLPSGRVLNYPCPRLGGKGTFTYLGVNQIKRKLERLETYGGKLVENVTQAVACDVLCHALVELEKNKFPVVLTIHDEVLVEVPDTPDYTHEQVESLMGKNAPWAEGLPLIAAGFETRRYRKG